MSLHEQKKKVARQANRKQNDGTSLQSRRESGLKGVSSLPRCRGVSVLKRILDMDEWLLLPDLSGSMSHRSVRIPRGT